MLQLLTKLIEWKDMGQPTNCVVFCFQNPEIRTVCVDLSDWAATRKAVEGIGPVDLLVNNAGFIKLDTFLETTEADINRYGAVSASIVYTQFKTLTHFTQSSTCSFIQLLTVSHSLHETKRMLVNIGHILFRCPIFDNI